MAETTWILCLNLRGARLFQTPRPLEAGRSGELAFVKEFKRPDKQLREMDFDSDADLPEVLTDQRRLAVEKEVAQSYSRFLAQELDRELHQKRFDSLILCAEPQLLQIFVTGLPKTLRKRVKGTVEIDLYNVNESDLSNYLQDLKKDSHQEGAA